MNKNRIKQILIGILALTTYFVLTLFEALPFEIVGISVENIPVWIKVVYLFIYEILIMALMLIIFYKKIIIDFKDILVKHKEYYSKYLKYYLIGLGVMLISNCLIIFVLNGDTSSNEETIRSLFKVNPFYIYFSSVLFAPLVEELTFRQGIRNIISNNLLFILISGIVFGGLHVIGDLNSLIDILYIIPYSSLGVVFAYMLSKTDNIFVSMGFHFMHNGILMAFQFVALIFS